MNDIPISSRIEQFRQKAASGTMTIEDAREAVALLRQGRKSASEAPRAKKAAGKAKGPVDTDALFGELDGL